MRRRRFPFDLPVALWLAIAVVLAALLRTYNLSWDQDAHLHPDERYLTMVVSAVRFPGELASDPTDPARGVGCSGVLDCIGVYLDTSASPLNPANYEQFAGYVYGTLPLFTTRALG